MWRRHTAILTRLPTFASLNGRLTRSLASSKMRENRLGVSCDFADAGLSASPPLSGTTPCPGSAAFCALRALTRIWTSLFLSSRFRAGLDRLLGFRQGAAKVEEQQRIF